MSNKRKVFFTWTGMGDNLALLCAAWNYFKITGEKPLIGNNNFIFSKYCSFITPHDWINFDNVIKNKESILERAEKENLEPIFLTASGYKYLAPKYENNVTTWPQQNLTARLCERMGLDGVADMSIPFDQEIIDVPDKTDYFCVMCGGLQKYKQIASEQMQAIVDYLSKFHTVIQLGASKDPLLNNVVDYRNCDLLKAWNLLHGSRFFVGGVGGLMHMARFAGTRSVIFQTSAEPDKHSYYKGNYQVRAMDQCHLCENNISDPQHYPCYFKYKCIRNVKASEVIKVIEANYDELCLKPVPEHLINISSDPANGIEDFDNAMKTLSYDYARN